MKTKFKLVAAMIVFAGVLSSNAQNVSSTVALTSGGNLAGTTGGSGSTYYGFSAGKFNTALFNTFIGALAGTSTTSGGSNVFVGRAAGSNNTTGTHNTFTGTNSGANNSSVIVSPSPSVTTGNYNSFYGSNSGNNTDLGSQNAFFGAGSGFVNGSGSNNTYLGCNSGSSNVGSGNVFIGYNSGLTTNKLGTAVSNTLVVDNVNTTTPLIWGDFAADQLKLNGKVGVGAVDRKSVV